MNIKHIKALFSGMLGTYFALIVLNNTTDYSSNFEFVKNVSNMHDTFNPALNGWRGTDNPILHHLLYASIIVTELVAAALLLYGAAIMYKQRNAPGFAFQLAKKWTTTGLVIGIVLWFFAFVTVGGEWFLMWQSSKWNAQSNAFFLTICFMLFLLFHVSNNEEQEVR
jgi:predicted small integral membrane protein